VVKIDDLANEITKQLRQFTDFVEEEVNLAKEEVAKTTVKTLKENSPKQTESYAKGWRIKRFSRDLVIHNATDYQLTHLLENGHINRDGTRTQGIVHIRPAEEIAVKEYVERVERAIQS
jgi:hypothetical protein